MNIRKIKINLKGLDKENFENLIKAFFDLPDPNSDELARRMDDLRGSLYFNLGYIELYVVKAIGLDVYEKEVKVIYDVIS
jgi:hypothetical protein